MYRTVDDVCRLVKEHAEKGNLTAALTTIAYFVRDVISYDAALANVFSSPPLDDVCLALGRGRYSGKTEERDPDQSVFIVTALFKVGGHSRTLLDLADADPAKKITVLVTNFDHDYPTEQIEDTVAYISRGRNIAVETAPLVSAEERLGWLQQRLHELRPARTYLLQHHQDSVSIAAAQPELVGKLFYVHHCDHSLALGVHIPHAVHVDLSTKSFYNCRVNERVNGGAIWPLTANVSRHRVDRPFLVNGPLRTATSGTTGKFDGSYLRNHIPYSIRYPNVVQLILQCTGGTHLHIGALSDQMLKDISDRLTEAHIEQNRFIYVPLVADVANTLLDFNVDAYIGSFPFGGGRTIVEAMGAGLPVIVHLNYRSFFLSSENETYGEAMTWGTIEDLTNHLQNLTIENLQRHAKLARSYFQEHYAPEVLRARMLATFEGHATDELVRPHHGHNPLQAFLDSQSALTDWMRPSLAENQQLRGEVQRMTAQFEQALSDIEQRTAELERKTADADRLRGELERETADAARLRGELGRETADAARLRGELEQAGANVAKLQHELSTVYRSRSWRMTAFLRRIPRIPRRR